MEYMNGRTCQLFENVSYLELVNQWESKTCWNHKEIYWPK